MSDDEFFCEDENQDQIYVEPPISRPLSQFQPKLPHIAEESKIGDLSVDVSHMERKGEGDENVLPNSSQMSHHSFEDNSSIHFKQNSKSSVEESWPESFKHGEGAIKFLNEDYNRRKDDLTPLRLPDSFVVSPPRFSASYHFPSSFVENDTFMNCTLQGVHTLNSYLVADRAVLYYGFRPVGSVSEDYITLTNISDHPVKISCSISPNTANSVFNLVFLKSTFVIDAHKKFFLILKFSPTAALRYKACLNLTDTTNKDSLKKIYLLGFGGQAKVMPIQLEKRSLTMSSSGRYQLSLRSLNSFQIAFRNIGERDAFVYLILQDINGEELLNAGFVSPANFVLKKSDKRIVDVRMYPKGPGSSRTSSIRGSTSGLSSRPPSALDSSVSSSATQTKFAFRILAFWGEEVQRKRIRCIEKNAKSDEKLMILNRHLSWKMEGEAQLDSEAKETMLSNDDKRLTKSYIRYNIIQIVDKRRGSSRNTSYQTVTGHTLIEMEPDDTLKAYNESLCTTLT